MIPFGLCNVAATFQRLIERILKPLLGYRVLVYLNDVLIFAATVDLLFEKLKQVLGHLPQAYLK